jgi:hypothetical protein
LSFKAVADFEEEPMNAYRMITAPFFLVGSERSGTTLLRLMLDGHPQLACNAEFEYAVERMPEGGGFPDLDDYYRFLQTDRIYLASSFAIDRSLSYPELIDSFLVQKRGTKPLVGATVHRHFDRLLRIWPDARFIHLLRDGRDVARSVVEMGWAGNAWAGSAVWATAEELWGGLSKQLPADRHLSVRFEDLIQDPVRELGRICQFCGVSYDPAMLDYPQRSTYEAPNPRMVGSWWRKMSAAEVQQVEARIGLLLEERGYPLSGQPRLRLTPATVARLRLHNYYGRTRFRIRRFGLGLVLQDFLTRRLRLRRLQAGVRLRMNAIENRHLK